MKKQQLTSRQKRLRKKANRFPRTSYNFRPLTPDECYCVCHLPIASRAWCNHCEGRNTVGMYYLIKSLVCELKNVVVVNGQA